MFRAFAWLHLIPNFCSQENYNLFIQVLLWCNDIDTESISVNSFKSLAYMQISH